MVIKNFINRKTGLSTDTKPSPSILKDFLFQETDTGSLYLSDGTTTTLTQGNTKTETYTNKKIDSESNTIVTTNGLMDQSPFSPNTLRQGGIIPAATTLDSFYGSLDPTGINIYNPLTVPTSTVSNGLLLEYKALLVNSKMGFASPNPIARRANSNEILGEFKCTNNNRMLVGFSDFFEFDLGTSVFTNVESGVAIGFTENTGNYSVFHNDGLGPMVIDSFSTPKDTILRTVEIKLSPTNVICTINSETITLTTKIPALNTDLYLIVYAVY